MYRPDVRVKPACTHMSPAAQGGSLMSDSAYVPTGSYTLRPLTPRTLLTCLRKAMRSCSVLLCSGAKMRL